MSVLTEVRASAAFHYQEILHTENIHEKFSMVANASSIWREYSIHSVKQARYR